LSFACQPRRPASQTAPNWLHEVKYDGYRIRLEQDDKRVRLITRNGND
jgi:ATP-dependent DNA ligase